ncbi:MAG: hypothetical protein JNL55_33630, partial [Steroidobacter sp.]
MSFPRVPWLRAGLVMAGAWMASLANAADKEPLTVNWYHSAPFLQPVIDEFTKQSGIAVKVTDSYDKFDTDVI